MGKSVLSVIIPVYNAAKTLRACVDSVLGQEQGAVEVILVDDGSAEETSALCDSLAEEYQGTLRVIHQKNAGSLAARMAGSAVATSDYLMYVDADDVLLDGAIAHILADISGGADLYLYDYIMDIVGGASANTVKIMEHQQTVEFSGVEKKQVSLAFMQGMMNTVCATAIRRAFFEGIAFCFPEEKIRNGEDRLQKMQMLVNAECIVYVPYAFYHYKWYPATQGGDLRAGKFSMRLYGDLCRAWPIERSFYSRLGLDEEEGRYYDRKKIARIIGLLEKSWGNGELTNGEIDTFVHMLREDVLFASLSASAVISGARPHLRRVATMIRAGKVGKLKAYWCFCRLIRKIRYGN